MGGSASNYDLNHLNHCVKHILQAWKIVVDVQFNSIWFFNRFYYNWTISMQCIAIKWMVLWLTIAILVLAHWQGSFQIFQPQLSFYPHLNITDQCFNLQVLHPHFIHFILLICIQIFHIISDIFVGDEMNMSKFQFLHAKKYICQTTRERKEDELNPSKWS